jgi:hypothetical protein
MAASVRPTVSASPSFGVPKWIVLALSGLTQMRQSGVDIPPAGFQSDPEGTASPSVRERVTLGLMVLAVGVAAWKAIDGDWLAMLLASAALAPANLLRVFDHYVWLPRRRSLLRPTLSVTAVALLVASMVTSGFGGFRSTATVTSAQVAAMTSYYEATDGPRDYGGPVGCVIDMLGATAGAGNLVRAYTIVTCFACPLSEQRGGEYPAVFDLNGTRVISLSEANAPGDPPFAEEVDRLFPSGLRGRAQGSPPEQDASLAQSRAPCGTR